MRKKKDEIKRLMENYYSVTGTGVICFDAQLNLLAFCPEKLPGQQMIHLFMGEITSFLAEIFAQKKPQRLFYTYFLHSDIACNFVFVMRGSGCIGAFLTEPLLLKRMDEAEIKQLISRFEVPPDRYKETIQTFMKKQVTPYEKVTSLGSVLFRLVNTLTMDEKPAQVFRSPQKPYTASRLARVAPEWSAEKGVERHMPYSVYQQIRQSIQKGDVDALSNLFNGLGADIAPMHQLHDSNYLRSIKNSFIKACSMACYAAVEANAPYVQMVDNADEFILQAERLNNVADIYDLMRTAFITFTRSVSLNGKTMHSKPVRQVLEYLHSHYSDKITLETLAGITNLSTFYLSNLIKNETGLSLTDHINQIRVEKSQKLMLDSNSSILDIAQRVGFRYQNHFAAVFKKLTGVTPTEYRKSMGSDQPESAPPADSASASETLSFAIQQVKSKLSVFSGSYDVARIVHPISRTAWLITSGCELNPEQTCYSFWDKNESCENCISTRAYLQNDTFFKVEQKGPKVFLVLAFPQPVGKSIFVAEVLKDISNRTVLDLDVNNVNTPCEPSQDLNDPLTGMFNRRYIDAQLPLDMRRSTLDKKQLTVILAALGIQGGAGEIHDMLLRAFADAIGSHLLSDEGWIGRYAGNIFLVVLYNHTEPQAHKIAQEISSDFHRRELPLDDINIQTNFGIQSLTDDITRAETLLYLAFAHIHGEHVEGMQH